jgi:hypothetical protein
MAKKITILIDEDGNCQIEGHEFHGPECEKVIREIEQALGTRTAVRYKPEYRQVQPNRQVQRGG